jgi:hypothetical protein
MKSGKRLTSYLSISNQKLFQSSFDRFSSVLVRRITVQAQKNNRTSTENNRTSTENNRTSTEGHRTYTETHRTHTEVLPYLHETLKATISITYRVIHTFCRGMYVFIYIYIYYYIPGVLNPKTRSAQ